MARAKRHFIPGHVWHLTHRCHKREFLLKFAKDRHRWLQWLYEARKRHDLVILNYVVTSNHIHLIIQDVSEENVIPKAIQLVAGRTAQEFNWRKRRKEDVSLNENKETYMFNALKDANSSNSAFSFGCSDPRLFKKTQVKSNITPHIYRNGLEISTYKDTDNCLKVLTINDYGNNIILTYCDLEKLKRMSKHPNHELKVSWHNGRARLYIDDTIADIYPRPGL